MSAKNSSDKGIRVSPKHGLNPTIPVCFWCQEPKNEIALLGQIDIDGQKDAEAPKHMILDYEPCESCAEKWSQGVAVIEISETQASPGQAGIHIMDGGKKKLAYPTGRYVVITLEAARNIFAGVDARPGMRLTVPRELFKKLFAGAMNGDSDNGGAVSSSDGGLLQ